MGEILSICEYQPEQQDLGPKLSGVQIEGRDEPANDAGNPYKRKGTITAAIAPVIKDVKPIDTSNKDIYEKFELNLPFGRTDPTDFW